MRNAVATTLRGWLTARGFIARSRTLALARDSRAVDVVMVRGTHHVRYFRGGGAVILGRPKENIKYIFGSQLRAAQNIMGRTKAAAAHIYAHQTLCD